MLSVFVVGVVTTVIVLASGTHYVGSNISVVYTASGIGGKLTATYQVGSNTAVNMAGSSGETVIEFGSEEPETVALLSPGDTIVPGYKEDIILTYTFVNEGPTFYATVTYSDTSSENPKDNIAITYKGESDTDYKNKSAVVTVAEDATVTYSIKLAVDLPYKDASMDGMIKWALTQDEPKVASPNILLNFGDNTNSNINASNVEVVMNEENTKFKITGPTPILSGMTTTNLSDLTNSNNAEFYYFTPNSAVVGSSSYVDPNSTYYISGEGTSTNPACETWYNIPDEETTLYACFMTPTCSTQDEIKSASGTVVPSHSVTYWQDYFTDLDFGYSYDNRFFGQNITIVVMPNSIYSLNGVGSASALSFRISIEDTTNTVLTCNLSTIWLPNSITKIPAYFFAGKYLSYPLEKLTSVIIPSSVTSIDSDAFYNCRGLTSITIPSGVTSIGQSAFYLCTSLTSITIPDSVTSIGGSTFSGCSGLTSITVASGNTTYYSSGNCIIETSSKTLILGCKNSTIPSGVTSIGSSAFYYCSGLTSITIPSSVTSIGNSAFYYCSGLTSITIPDSVTSIGNYAFEDCSGLTSITIPSGVTSIGSRAFSDCSELTSITFAETSYTWKIGSAVSAYSPTDPSTNATYLRSTYYNYYWTKNS